MEEGRTRVEDRGGEEEEGGGRSEGLSLSEEQTESQLRRRDDENLENSALSCQRSLEEQKGGNGNREVNL